MADTPTNTIAAAKPGSGPLSGLYKTSTEIAQDAASQLKQIQAANAAQNALEGYTKGLDGIYTPVADLVKSVGNKLMEMAGVNPATAAAAEKVADALGITKDAPATNEAAGVTPPTDKAAAAQAATAQQSEPQQTGAWPNDPEAVTKMVAKMRTVQPQEEVAATELSSQMLKDLYPRQPNDYHNYGWYANPYGLRLTEDPAKDFVTLLENLKWIAEYDEQHSEEDGATLDKLFDIMKSSNLGDGKDNVNGLSDSLGKDTSFFTAPNYSDTRLGFNDAINPLWQFNRDDDIIPRQLVVDKIGVNLRGTNDSLLNPPNGMGRVYAEHYDAKQHILWLSFGVPEYTNALSFFHNAGNATAADTMRTGAVRNAIGKLIKHAYKSVIWAVTLPVTAPFILMRWLRRIDSEQITSYYSLRLAMPLYFEMVNTMMSYLAVAMGLYPEIVGQRKDTTAKSVQRSKENTGDIEQSTTRSATVDGDEVTNAKATQGRVQNDNAREFFNSRLSNSNDCGIPDMLREGLDIYLILNRRARMYQDAAAKVTTRELMDAQRIGSENSKSRADWFLDPNAPTTETLEDGTRKKMSDDKLKTDLRQMFSAIKSTVLGCNDFIGFRIEKGQTPSESFSNATGELSIASQINAKAQENVDLNASNGGGFFFKNFGRLLQQGLKGMATGLATDLAASITSAIGVGDIGVVMTAGNGFVLFPEVWKNSSFSKSMSFNVQLRSRYGDPVSIFQNIYVPLLMLMAAGMPRGVGDSMYTSPFLLRAFCKGMYAIPLGIIESLSITRGTGGEYNWTSDMLPMGIDVSVNIKDLSPAMFLSVQDIGIFDTFTRNTALHEYLDTLAALGVSERTRMWPKLRRKLQAALQLKKNTIFNPNFWSYRMGMTGGLRAIGALSPWSYYEKSDMQRMARD